MFPTRLALVICGRLGFHGPVLGYDRLSLSMEQSQSGRDNGNQSKQFLLNYRLFY